jgi:hypothetical protein
MFAPVSQKSDTRVVKLRPKWIINTKTSQPKPPKLLPVAVQRVQEAHVFVNLETFNDVAGY